MKYSGAEFSQQSRVTPTKHTVGSSRTYFTSSPSRSRITIRMYFLPRVLDFNRPKDRSSKRGLH